jgi:hypothetical protein
LGDPRFTSSGLSIADADAFLPHLAKFVSRPRTGAEVEDLLRRNPAGSPCDPLGGGHVDLLTDHSSPSVGTAARVSGGAATARR